MSTTWFQLVLVAWFSLALLSFGVLLWRPAPYGRYFESGWGRPLDARWGWILMETPAVLVLPAWYLADTPHVDATGAVFVTLWLFHYVHRAWIYPFRKDSGRPMPLALALCAVGFNVVNGSINGAWLFRLAPPYGNSWLSDPRFIAGTAIFLAGFTINVHADTLLIRLRRRRGAYAIPRGGLFRWISCPNYLGEIVEWIGWAVLTWSAAGLSFAAWTAANLVPRAVAHHHDYRRRFDDYPDSRRAILPFVV